MTIIDERINQTTKSIRKRVDLFDGGGSFKGLQNTVSKLENTSGFQSVVEVRGQLDEITSTAITTVEELKSAISTINEIATVLAQGFVTGFEALIVETIGLFTVATVQSISKLADDAKVLFCDRFTLNGDPIVSNILSFIAGVAGMINSLSADCDRSTLPNLLQNIDYHDVHLLGNIYSIAATEAIYQGNPSVAAAVIPYIAPEVLSENAPSIVQAVLQHSEPYNNATDNQVVLETLLDQVESVDAIGVNLPTPFVVDNNELTENILPTLTSVHCQDALSPVSVFHALTSHPWSQTT